MRSGGPGQRQAPRPVRLPRQHPRLINLAEIAPESSKRLSRDRFAAGCLPAESRFWKGHLGVPADFPIGILTWTRPRSRTHPGIPQLQLWRAEQPAAPSDAAADDGRTVRSPPPARSPHRRPSLSSLLLPFAALAQTKLDVSASTARDPG